MFSQVSQVDSKHTQHQVSYHQIFQFSSWLVLPYKYQYSGVSGLQPWRFTQNLVFFFLFFFFFFLVTQKQVFQCQQTASALLAGFGVDICAVYTLDPRWSLAVTNRLFFLEIFWTWWWSYHLLVIAKLKLLMLWCICHWKLKVFTQLNWTRYSNYNLGLVVFVYVGMYVCDCVFVSPCTCMTFSTTHT